MDDRTREILDMIKKEMEKALEHNLFENIGIPNEGELEVINVSPERALLKIVLKENENDCTND